MKEIVELNDKDLEKVAGGKGEQGQENSTNNSYTCNNNRGIGTRVTVNML